MNLSRAGRGATGRRRRVLLAIASAAFTLLLVASLVTLFISSSPALP